MKTTLLIISVAATNVKFEPTLKRPNVVLVVADDYGYNDIGYHQGVIKTPHLDEISSNGVRLENYYVQPICTPSRSQLMSGRYQIHTGLQHQLIWRGLDSGLPLDNELMPEALLACGYSTMAVGKWHLGYAKSAQTPWGRGFQRYTGYLGGSEDYYKKTSCVDKHNCGVDMTTEGETEGSRLYTNNRTAYSAFEYIDQAKDYLTTRDGEKPFFLYLPLQSVHMPLQVPSQYMDPYRNIIKTHARLTYAGMVSVLDEAVGNLTNYLKEEKLWDDTIFIFSTDNGGQAYAGGNNLPYRGNKGGYWEGGIHGVGFVAGGYFEENKKHAAVSHELMHISDWFPTILEATACSLSDKTAVLDGTSQWKMLTQNAPSDRFEILHNIDPLSTTDGTDNRTFPVEYDITKQSALRFGKWKILTGDPGYPDYPIQTPPQNHFLDDKVLSQLSELPTAFIPIRPARLTRLVRLFDLEADPLEEYEVSDNHPDIVNLLMDRLQYYNSTQVAVNFPPVDPKSFPKYHDGFWKPWYG